jgi:hypothetical protein
MSSTWDEALPSVVEGDALADWIDARLDAFSPKVRYWRMGVLGRDPSQIVSATPDQRMVSLNVPLAEYVIVRAHAQRRGLSVPKFFRGATAYALGVEGVPPEQREWLGHYGIWTPPEEAP